ncbi:MAG: transcription termination/antitermination protein NusA [Proteobacteria bacterium]|nr:transcription termination/antitermination protein NusA [Pseudomonadota bacterium]MCP4916068.1 transcription termination/antitermination protein NusA [Pseudomonadota bacterium]
MQSELARLIDIVHREKNIPRDAVIEVVEAAMEAAARKKYGPEHDIEGQYNEELGEVQLFEFKTVVDDIEDEENEIVIDEARDLDPECEPGDSLGMIIDITELGRIAAMTAKQVIIQKVRDAEREVTFNEFRDRKGELITGIVRRFEKGNIIVDLGRAEAILPRREQVLTETYRQGDRIQAYVLDIARASRSSQVVLSRTHPGLLMKLFELEVPEIYEGIVRIEACAREPGHRAKIAVSSVDPDVDPVGACVGLKGSRVQAVVGELRGEAIDIIPFHPDPARFIVHAIAPAQVTRVYIDEHTHCMELIVPDDQLSKAIGRKGQNVRLAAQLTGWRIDIYSETRHAELNDQAYSELSRLDGLDEETVELLIRHGFRTAKELADAQPYEISSILDVGEDAALELTKKADAILEELILEEAERMRQAAELVEDLPPEADEDE